MPPRRRKPSGLTDEDVARLRGQLGEGRKPRVALSGPQFEAGAAGTVVRIGDPAVDGADFLTVRVKVNGVTDELAFAPTELSLGGRTKAGGSGAAGTGTGGGGSAGAGTAGTASARGVPPRASAKAVAAAPEPAAAPAAGSGPPPQAGTTDPAAASSAPDAGTAARAAAAAQPAPSAGQPPTASRRRKAPATPTVSVTISSAGAAWSVSASRGARTIVRGVPVTPGLVTAIADLLDQPAVSEAVAEINETALEQARQRAEQLRAELSDLEAVLATHRAPR